VIELLIEARRRNLLPARRSVAGLAGLFKATVMNVGVAVRTLGERDSLVPGLAIRAWRVAFRASHLHVQPGQRVFRLGVVEFLDRGFPVGEVVALQAILPKPSLMGIFMAGGARLGNAQKSLIQVLYLDKGTLGCRDMLGAMTSIAGQARVFRFKRVSGLFVVKGILIPLDDREIFSVMVGVAAHATLTGTRLKTVRRVESAARSDARGDFCVTLQTFKRWLSRREFVAGRTVARPVQRLVGSREWAGRNLGNSRTGCDHQRQQQNLDEDRRELTAVNLGFGCNKTAPC